MSILRNSAIAALVTGAALVAPAAASASTTQASVPAAHAAASAPASVHRAICTRQTFNVYHGHARFPFCYKGTGSARPEIKDVYRVTTGRNWGCMLTRPGRVYLYRSFRPGQNINFRPHVELVSFTLSPRPVFCPRR